MIGDKGGNGSGEIGLVMMTLVMMNDVMAILISIAGWGVVPRMAPPPSQGVQLERL